MNKKEVTIKRVTRSYAEIQKAFNKARGGDGTYEPEDKSLVMFQPCPKRAHGGELQFHYGVDKKALTVIFERILNMDSSKDFGKFWDKIQTWYKKLIIRIPPSGLKLNVTTQKERITTAVQKEGGGIQEIEQFIDVPEFPEDYLIWKHFQTHPAFAKDLRSVNGHKVYFEDSEELLASTIEFSKLRDQAIGLRLTAKDEDYLMYVYLFRTKPVKHDLHGVNLLDMTHAQLRLTLEELVYHYPQEFIDIVNDKRSKIKWYIEMFVSQNLLTRQTGQYFYDGTLIGTIDKTISWMQLPEQSDTVNSLIQNLHVNLREKLHIDTDNFKNELQRKTNGTTRKTPPKNKTK